MRSGDPVQRALAQDLDMGEALAIGHDRDVELARRSCSSSAELPSQTTETSRADAAREAGQDDGRKLSA